MHPMQYIEQLACRLGPLKWPRITLENAPTEDVGDDAINVEMII